MTNAYATECNGESTCILLGAPNLDYLRYFGGGWMPKVLRCADVVGSCDFVARGDSEGEVDKELGPMTQLT